MIPQPDPYREWDAAYVLGALSPAERQVYERHLAVCPACEGEITALAGMAGILSRVPAARAAELLAPAQQAPVSLLPGLLRAARAARRRALAVTAVAIVGAVVAVVAVAATVAPCR